MTSKRSVLSAASAILLALALAGCGGGDGEALASGGGSSGGGSSGGGSSGGGDSGGGNQQAGSSPDAFISRVIAVINSTSDTAEPEDISSVTATKPENAEPVPVS